MLLVRGVGAAELVNIAIKEKLRFCRHIRSWEIVEEFNCFDQFLSFCSHEETMDFVMKRNISEEPLSVRNLQQFGDEASHPISAIEFSVGAG